MKLEREHIANLMYDMLDAWSIATTIDKAKHFKRQFPFLANDMVYTYRLSYGAILCKLTDPATQGRYKNLCFESEIKSMKRGSRKTQALDLLAKIRRKSNQYRAVRNKIGSHTCRQVMRSRRRITTPTIKKTEEINRLLAELYELVFNSVFPDPPVQTPNDLAALLNDLQSNRPLQLTGNSVGRIKEDKH